jgi:hypothetical protein
VGRLCEHGGMELTPATYRCDEDGHDLTELVRDQLEESVPAMFGRGRSDEFRVIVSCPGRTPPHQVGCKGQVRYAR